MNVVGPCDQRKITQWIIEVKLVIVWFLTVKERKQLITFFPACMKKNENKDSQTMGSCASRLCEVNRCIPFARLSMIVRWHIFCSKHMNALCTRSFVLITYSSWEDRIYSTFFPYLFQIVYSNERTNDACEQIDITNNPRSLSLEIQNRKKKLNKERDIWNTNCDCNENRSEKWFWNLSTVWFMAS